MRRHSANELIYTANILGPDGTTAVASGVPCGVEDLAGRRLEQAQLIASETSHMILMRTPDTAALTDSSYIACDGNVYVVDYRQDPRSPRPKMWTEVYCHLERAGL
jgi:hypothetical protein